MQYTYTSKDNLLIDANVLIYVYCPLQSNQYSASISHFTNTMQKISAAKSSVFVNALIISEFFNRWLRLDFKKSGLADFKKDYRKSARYEKTLKAITRELNKFYSQCNVKHLDDGFSMFNFGDQYAKFPESDFNDLVIAEVAKANDCKIVSQDGDFAQYGVTVIR